MVCIEDEVEINAPLEKVWNSFIDLTCWADWNSVLTKVKPRCGNCIEADGSFSCCVTPFGVPVFFETRIDEISPMERIVWTGSKYMIHGTHEFLFVENEAAVKLISREVMRGLPVSFGGFFFPVRRFRALTREFLEALRKYAEREGQ